MRIAALIVASAAALALTACQKAEETAPEASSEAVEAAGIADDAAVTTTIEQANDDARVAAEAKGATDPTLDKAGIFFGLGKALFVLDRPKEALPYLERVGERLDPPLLAETALYLGQIYAAQGDLEKADHYFDTVRRLAPEIGARLPPRTEGKR